MLTNLYLFTGENQYELRQELARRKDNFSQKFGAESIFTYHSENRNAGEIKQNLYGGGLFVTKKLIILEGVPLDNEQTNKLKEEQYGKLTEDIIATPNIPNDTLLICVSYAPDKRGRFYKFLTKEGQIKEFKLLDKNGLRLFVKQQAEGIKMDDGAIKALIEKVGGDQFRLASEIEKLRYWQQKNATSSITEAVIAEVTFGQVEAESFKFFDHLFSAPTQSCIILDAMQAEGTDRNQVGGLLYRGLRNYLIVLDLTQQGIQESKSIASEGKMPPFTASILLKQLPLLKEKKAFITSFFKKLVLLDYDIKTGALPTDYFWVAVKEIILKNNADSL